MTTLHVIRVFCDEAGEHGNPLGVFLDSALVAVDDRQAVATRLGFSETVFVDDAFTGRLQIFTPANELPFAGHPLVGTAWLLAHQGEAVTRLLPPAGEVPTWREGDLQWIRGRAEWAPEMELRQYRSPAEIDALDTSSMNEGFVDAWAWIDEMAGTVRSRVFAPEIGIPEDEATGAAAVRLVSELDRPIVIHQGRGSRIAARPGVWGTAEIGGRVSWVEESDDPGR